jgi:hypothetical protein
MMKTAKNFDCLRMKEELQTKVQKKWEGLSVEGILQEVRDYLHSSESDLAYWWRSVPYEQSAISESKGPDAAKSL